MKFRFLLFFVFVIAMSCSNVIIDAGRNQDDSQASSVQKFDEYAQQMKFYSILYDESYASDILTNVIRGPVFIEFQDQIEAILHRKLAFPISIQNKINSQSVLWWYSIPIDLIDLLCIDGNAKKINSDQIFRSLIYSDGGLGIIHKYLDLLEKDLELINSNIENKKRIFDFDGIEEIFPGEQLGKNFADLYHTQKLLNCGYDFIIFIDNLVKHRIINKKTEFLETRLIQLKAEFNNINLMLRNQEFKADCYYDFEALNNVDSRYEDVQFNETMINFYFNNLSTNREEKILDQIGENLFVHHEFQKIIQSTYKSSVATQNFIIENQIFNKMQLPFLKVTNYRSHLQLLVRTEKMDEKIFLLSNPSNLLYKNIQNNLLSTSLKDILFLKRLSLLRLSLLSKFYSGTDLLEARKAAAAWDHENILLPIKNLVNSMSNNMTEEINEISYIPKLPSKKNYKYWYEFTNDISKDVYYHYSTVEENYSEKMGIHEKVVDLEKFNEAVTTSIIDVLSNEIYKYNGMMIVSAVEIAEWEILLYSHIMAAF